MFKKLVILALAATVIGVATIPLWTSKVADNAFQHPLDPESPGKVKEAMMVKIRLQRYKQARVLAEKAIIYFPDCEEMPYFIYNAARCAEKEKEHQVAMFWYEKFIKRFPDHIWTTQAKNSLNKLKGMYGETQ